jgi:hypothetical protein
LSLMVMVLAVQLASEETIAGRTGSDPTGSTRARARGSSMGVGTWK